MTAAILQFTPRRKPGPRLQSERSKAEPLSAFAAFVSYYFRDAAMDERLTGPQRLLILELSILAAEAAGRPLGYSISEIAAMFEWNAVEVRADAEACAALGYLDLAADIMLLRDPRDRRVKMAAS